MEQITSKPFTYEIVNRSPTVTVVKLSGAFRRGNGEYSYFVRFYTDLQTLQRQASRSLILFDVSGLTFWDTMGIHKVVDFVFDVNSKFGSRAGVFGQKKSLLYVTAMERKPNVGSKVVPWADTEDELVKALTE